MRLFLSFALLFAVAIVGTITVSAQTTEFTYQGSLQNSAAPANGNFDFEFLLFDSLTGGVQQGATLTRSTVAVAAGTFAVKLDFGSQFPGANRFLEIHVRPTGGGAFTPLTPRQPVSSTPYSVQSVNATSATTAINANNAAFATMASNSIQLDGRTSAGYVQNTTSQQISTNFNIGGTGTANILDATTQYNLGGSRFLSSGGAGSNNAFAGSSAGSANTSGVNNSFFGVDSGKLNSSGSDNSFIGRGSGQGNAAGGYNTFVGEFAGFGNTSGSNNTAVGWRANVGAADLTYATAVGSDAIVSTSNTIVLGRSLGQDRVQIPGIVTGGSAQLCFASGGYIALCSSSLRYKANIWSFNDGLTLIKRLRPITFDWKSDGKHDLGLGAEDVAALEPLLVTYNKDGQVEGVKYDRVGVVLINAVKEQQTQIEAQARQIEMLMKIVCSQKKNAEVCKGAAARK